MQVIAKGASCVKMRKLYTDGSDPKQRYSCERCFVDAKAIQTLAMSVDPKRTEEILDRIAANQDAAAAAAAVPSPLPSIRRPRAWLSRMPCAFMLRCLDKCKQCFARSLHVSQSRSVSHSSSPSARWSFRSSRRWQVLLSRASPRKTRR